MVVFGSNPQITDDGMHLALLTRINRSGLEALAFNATGLKSIDLSKLERVTDRSLMKLIERCLNLRALSIHACFQVQAAILASTFFYLVYSDH